MSLALTTLLSPLCGHSSVELTSPAPSAARVLPPLSMTSIAAKVEANTQARQEVSAVEADHPNPL